MAKREQVRGATKIGLLAAAAVAALMLVPAGETGSALAADAPTIRVAYAGSMGAVMDQKIGPEFAMVHAADYQGIGQAAYALAHLLEAKQLRADVFVSITPGPMRILLKNGLIKEAIPVASTQMVLAYGPKSQFANAFAAAGSASGQPWYKVLGSTGLRFGRTDPATDPQGRNVIFTFKLAEKYYSAAGLEKQILGEPRNPAQIFTEPSILTRLASGQIDATVGYLSAIKSQHLPYIALPREINLADPAFFDSWYSKAGFAITGPDGKPITAKPEPLVFYAAVLTNAEHPELAAAFVDFMHGPRGQQMLGGSGYDATAAATLK
ncbi:MAG TPA: extracellular solute-binding protein [Candidatus Binataceae bacterium]|nr:extracellular solute-binding protein [Candidatus Binataceae bacterium]